MSVQVMDALSFEDQWSGESLEQCLGLVMGC